MSMVQAPTLERTPAVLTAPVHSPAGPQSRPYLPYPDLLRLLACLAVIVIHASTASLFDPALPRTQWLAPALFMSLFRFGSSMFVMVSGLLLLDPARPEPTGATIRQRLIRTLVPLALWSVIYYTWHWHLYHEHPFTLRHMAKQILSNECAVHLWFLYMIAGLYLALPILRPLSRNPRLVRYYLACWVPLGLIPSTALAVGWNLNWKTHLFTGYTGYFLLGYYLQHVAPERWRQKRWLPVVYLLGAGFVAAGTCLLKELRRPDPAAFMEILTVPVLMITVSLFLTLRNLDLAWLVPHAPLLRRLGSSTYGVYLMHVLVLEHLRKLWPILGLGEAVQTPWLEIPWTAAWTFTISFLLVLALRRLPGCRLLCP